MSIFIDTEIAPARRNRTLLGFIFPNFLSDPTKPAAKGKGAVTQTRGVCRAPAAGFLGAGLRRGRNLRSMERPRLHPASHCPLLVFSRSDGRSSVGAAAYASRSRMTDLRTGRVHNYERLHGLLAEGLLNWKGLAEELWNAAEASEKRINARVARELRPALPAELPLDEQRRLVHGFCCFLKDRYGVAAHYVIHAPSFHKKSDSKQFWKKREELHDPNSHDKILADREFTNLNFHAHIRWTTRKVDKMTGQFGDKTRVLDDKKTGPEEVRAIRAEWERRTNAALARVGSKSRIDLRSYDAMAAAGDAPEGLEAQEHMGPRNTAKARAAEHAFDPLMPSMAIRNYKVNERNDQRWQSSLELRQLAREKARLEGESERIAREHEGRRLEQVEIDKEKIRAARSEHERKDAVTAASSAHVPDIDKGLAAAIAWAMADEPSPASEACQEFDRQLDLEARGAPYSIPADKNSLRVRKKVAQRQRTRA